MPLDQLLGWAVIAFPFLLTILFVFIPARAEDERTHKKWRNRLVAVGAIFSLLAWWQQARSLQAAKMDRDEAIKITSEQVTKSVTEAVGSQYKELIGSLTNQIGVLKGQLVEQGKKVDVIQKSNIVTGKNPIKVEVTNPSASSGDTAEEKEKRAVARNQIAVFIRQGLSIQQKCLSPMPNAALGGKADIWNKDVFHYLASVDSSFAARYDASTGLAYSHGSGQMKVPEINENIWNFINVRLQTLGEILKELHD